VILAALLLVQADPAGPLLDELAAARSATAVLQRRCAEPIAAKVEAVPARAPTAEQRTRLGVGPDEAVSYRSVVLTCGAKGLSVAQNWYVPARLTPEMNAALAGGTPFGAAIRPLAPTREVLDYATQASDPAIFPYVVRMHALVRDGQGRPLAEVVENYTPYMLSLPVQP